MFVRDITNTCHWPHSSMSRVAFIRLLFSNTSVLNLCSLVLDRFIAMVHPLKYITLMTRRRITQVIFFSWVLTIIFNALKVIYYVVYFKTIAVPLIWLHLICFEFLPSVVLILCFVSMIFRVRRNDRSARIVKKKTGQDFRITPYINYAYIHCLKKTKDRTILSLWDFSYCFRNF